MLRPWRRRRGQHVPRPLPDSGLWTLPAAVTVAAAATPIATPAAALVAATASAALAAATPAIASAPAAGPA